MLRRMSPSAWLAALALLLLSMLSAPARAQPASAPEGMQTTSCYLTFDVDNCVTTFGPPRNPHVIAVPAAQSAEERSSLETRDRRWVERCRPVIRQDHYGMPRYSYAAPGCEFGRLD